MAGIEVRQLCFAYPGANERPVFTDLSFTVPEGAFFTILGPSGGGKSTLLRLVAGLIRPCRGSICCNGEPVTGPGRERAIVFQQGGLFPWLTALGNVAFAASRTHPDMTREHCREFAARMLARVGLEHALSKWPFQLSGGMKQRVAIARALAMETRVLLMDEPFSALDYRNRCLLQDLVIKLWADSGATVLFVTHDIDEALLVSDSILFLDGDRRAPVLPLGIPRPRPRSLLTSAQFCEMRKHFISLFHGGEIFSLSSK